ncbi:PEP-CTERM sorting domain-containing protein [Massilia sp. METH4]|uniref:PEP-CTERM sorting domain-containing protein n=1 Tax=Massilia sp. METH4 TaxID=3123041 RepID=UPI0030D26766
MTRFATYASTMIAAAFLAVPAAHAAQSTASAAFSNVQFSVVDLTPNDGHAAGYAFSPRTSEFEARITNGWYSDGMSSAPYFPVPVNVSATYRDDFASASSNGQLGSLAASVDTSSPYRGEYDAAWASGQQFVHVLIKAHTAFAVSGEVDAAVWASAYDDPRLAANASVFAGLGRLSDGQSLSRELSLETGLSSSYSDTFSFYLQNNNDYDIETTMYFTVQASTKGSVSPIPEPATYLMIGAGLLLVAGSRHIHRNKR